MINALLNASLGGPQGSFTPQPPPLSAPGGPQGSFTPQDSPPMSGGKGGVGGGQAKPMQGNYVSNNDFFNEKIVQLPSPQGYASPPMVGGKGGLPRPQTAVPAPTQGRYAPLTPSGNFNVNQASAGALEKAMQGTQMGMGFQAPTMSAFGYGPAQQRAQQLASTNIAQYESPYQQAVIDRTLSDLAGAQEKQLNVMGAQAEAANAFGGSRQALEAAETRKGFAKQAADTVANLRQSGFQQAQQAAQFDVGQRAAVEAANAAARTAASQYGATSAQRAQEQDFSNRLAANQARLSAAQQMGSLGQQAFSTGQSIQQQQMQQGLLQQGLQQALIDAARGQFAGYAGAPSTALQAPLAALGVSPVPETRTTTKKPGLFDYLSLGATAYASDERLKTNIKSLGKEAGINVYSWDWNDEGKRVADPAQPTVGVMAQELQATHPHLVARANDGYLRVNYAGLVSELGAA